MPCGVDNPRAIAVLSLNHVGDVLFTTPAIAALKRRYPQARLIAITAAGVSAILENNPNVQEILVRKTRSFPETCRLARHLRRQGTDIVVDFSYSSFRLALLAWLSGARRRVGFCHTPAKVLLTDCVPNDPAVHQIQTYLDLVALVDACGSLSPPQMFLTEDDLAWARAFLESQGVRDESVVGLNPGGTVPPNRWFPEYYAALADMLVDTGMRVVLFGSKQEVSLAEQIALQMRSLPVLAAGRTDLRQLAGLIAACDTFVSGDTGPLHMAAALGVPVVGIYGPASPARTGPIGRESVVLRKDLPCGPCWRHPTCRELDCLRAVEPGEVLAAVRNVAVSRGPVSRIRS